MIIVVYDLLACRKKLTKACVQQQLVSDQLEGLYVRLERCKAASNTAFCYTLSMRVQVLEGVHEAYEVYSIYMSDRLMELAEYIEQVRRQQPHLGPLLDHLTGPHNA